MKKILLSITAIIAATSLNAQVVYSENFEGVDNWTPEQEWSAIDVDGDDENWAFYNIGTVAAPNIAAGSRSWDDAPLTPNNYFISPAINLSSIAGLGAELSFKVRALDPEFFAENYSVYAVAAADQTALITALVSATPVFTEVIANAALNTRVVNVSAIAGATSAYIVFRHHNVTDQNIFVIDDITVTGVAGLNEIELIANVYPNPANDVLNINVANAEFVAANVYSLAGQKLISSTASSVDVSSLATGMYIYEVVGSNGGILKNTFVKK